MDTYKVHCYTYLSVCYVHSSHHSLWRHTKSTATLTSVFVMFTPATTPCGDIQSPLLHSLQCLLCSLPVETYKVHCYTYLCVCYVHSSHHSLWRYTKSTATLTSVFVMFTPATTPCGDIQSPLLHLTQCLLCSLQPPLPVETYKVHCYTYLSVCYVHSSHHSLLRYTKSTATLTSVFVMFTPCGDIQSPLLHLPQCLLCSLPVETYKVHCYTYLCVCYVHSSHHSLWRHTKSTATLTSVFAMFTPATTPCGDIQSPLLHLPQCLLCSLPVETYKVHCYTYLSVCYVHSLWRYTKSTATLTSVFVMFTPCGDIQSPLLHLPQCTPCGDIQSPLLHLPQCLLCSLQPPLPVETYKVHCYTYLCVCYVHSSHHSLWRHTKSTATLTSVFVMFTPWGDIQSPLLHLPQCLLCSLPVETYKVLCYTYLSVCYVDSSHHSLWRYTKSTATLTSVFVTSTPATTPCTKGSRRAKSNAISRKYN